MKGIKMKEEHRQPKIKHPSAKMPKELAKITMLEAREKSHRVPEGVLDKTGQESPVEYADNQMGSAEEWMAERTVSSASAASRKLAKSSYEKILKRKKAEQVIAEGMKGAEGIAEADGTMAAKEALSPAVRAETNPDRLKSGSAEQVIDMQKIKLKPERRESLRSLAGRKVKTAPRMVKSSPISSGQIRASQAALQKQQAVYTKKAAKQMTVKSAKAMRTAKKISVQSGKKAVQVTEKGISAAVKTTALAAKSLRVLCAGGAGVAIFFIVILGVIGGFLMNENSRSTTPLSPEVLNYTPIIQRYAQEYGIPEYVQVIQAIMMQESGGQGTDPMQASECPYNTQYPHSPGGITDPEYSIQVGIQNYADCVRQAGCTSPQDLDRLKLSLQGYNYGNGYISWAIRNFGGYSEANALQFSKEQAAAHGWSGYGDPEYVPHVLRYYAGGNLFAGLFGNSQMVSVALSQLGNEGGQKYWSWYGFSSREEWCACFVSWCADQSGLLANGIVPRFSLCSDGMNWFQSCGKWQGSDYQPSAGTIIFFDWNGDGNPDHVGVVEKCENGRVYTVEGNSGDAVRQRNYAIGAGVILGYGLLKCF